MFLKLSQSCMSDSFPALEMAKDYVDNAEEILNKTESKKLISLLSGNVGVHIVSAAVNKALNLPVDKDIKNILRGMSIFENPEYLDDSQDEMLVGRCGFVLGIQWLQKQLKTDIISQDDMKELAQVMLKSGREYARANEHSVPLLYQYHGREYLGAAHGVSAILLSLLNIPLKEGDLSDVKTTIDAILELQDESGNFPSKFNKPQETHLVHWCHGAPGIVFLMAKAYIIFKDPKYLDSCLMCGDLVWRKGLLRKGPGLCHGIASSGYVFFILFRLTHDRKHLYRAMKFAEFLNEDRFLKEAREPDRPYSLFEGLSGTICFLLDLLQPETAEFPFMNIF